jgi:hypothetical protein
MGNFCSPDVIEIHHDGWKALTALEVWATLDTFNELVHPLPSLVSVLLDARQVKFAVLFVPLPHVVAVILPIASGSMSGMPS